MADIKLKGGGLVKRIDWVYDEVADEGSYVSTDISDDVAAYMFEPAEIEGELYLRDIFTLLERNPVLLVVLRRDWANEYLAEFRKVRDDAKPHTGEYSADGIEYLELYQLWERDSATGELTGHHRLSLHGVGFELRDDVMREDWVAHTKGTRIHWAVDMLPLVEVINLPLRLNTRVQICEGDPGRDSYGEELETLTSYPTLGQIIHGALWELSFYGGPESTAQKKAEVLLLAEEAKQACSAGDTSKLIDMSIDDLPAR